MEKEKEIWEFMGSVNKHMENDAIFKENYLKMETRVGKVENRITKAETKQSVIQWIGGTLTFVGLGFLARMIIKTY
jgi:hypothetical protein